MSGPVRQVTGRFLAVTSATLSCSCRHTRPGMSPAAHTGDGCSDLIVVQETSHLHYLRYLFRHKHNANCDDMLLSSHLCCGYIVMTGLRTTVTPPPPCPSSPPPGSPTGTSTRTRGTRFSVNTLCSVYPH